MTMRLRLTCQETARLVLEGEERALPLTERALIRLHLAVCQGCTNFTRQVALMRGALGQWRQYRDGGGEGDSSNDPAR